jgi:hypothetical protein
MGFVSVAEWGGPAAPFQLAGKNPLHHLAGHSGIRDDLYRYAGQHLGFYGWLRVADARIGRRIGLGLMDLPDRLWRDAYEDQLHPAEAADEAISEMAAELGLPEP